MRSEAVSNAADTAGASVVARELAKTYRLGELVRLEHTLKRVLGRAGDPEAFGALDRVTFTTNPGECFGIVGSNGSGKSTVLQMLAGITAPPGGYSNVRGAVLVA